MLTRDDIETLLGTPARPAVSIYTPTNLPSLAIRQDAIRLGNQLQQARERLGRMGWRNTEIDDLLRPASTVLGDDEFWKNNTAGLAIFLAPGVAPRLWRLPRPVEELVVVGARFHIAPLLPQQDGEGAYFILAVSARRARLFKAGRLSMAEITATGLPQSVAQTVADRTEFQPSVHANPMASVRKGRDGSPSPVPADQNFGSSPEDQRKAELIQYLSKLARAFEQGFGDLRAPVVLAAQPEVAGNFRAQANIKVLWPDTLEVNPDALDEDELRRRAWDLVGPHLAGGTDAAIDHFNSLFNEGSPRASLEPAEIVKAARWGRLDTLILAEGEHVWGRFDEQADRVETHAEPDPLDEDLLDLAVQQTLLNGGDVKVVARPHVPRGAAAAGIMRY